NLLAQVINDAKQDIPEFETDDDLTPADLMKYGIVKIKLPKSVIINNELAAKALNETYTPYSYEGSGSNSLEYTQINYENAECEDVPTEWVPIGPIRKNEASGTASYTQSWSMAVSGTASNSFEVAMWFFVPKLQTGVTYGSSNGGSISCDIPPGGELQFQVNPNSIKITGTRERTLQIVRNYLRTKLKLGNYVQRYPKYISVGHDVETACVTDPE
ncbi:uncharacterized protein CANTADRAFT_29739, partial [Suhomyces tanzawaensis NRRL Y-17324]